MGLKSIIHVVKMNKILLGCMLTLPISGPFFAQSDSSQPAPDGTFCIVNAAEEELFFVTETREGSRNFSSLKPGDRLCSETTQADDGIVSVFQSENSLEGCSRIIETGTSEAMLVYAEFDRCGWESHGN